MLDDFRLVLKNKDMFDAKYEQFDEYSDVPRIFELRDVIVSFNNNNLLNEFDEIGHYCVDRDNFDFKPKKSNVNFNSFLLMGEKILRNPIIPLIIPFISDFIEYYCIEAVLMLLEFNYFHYSKKRCSLERVIEYVFNGDIILYLSFFVEDFDKEDILPEFDESFFKKIKNMNFQDKRAEKLESFIRGGYLVWVVVEHDVTTLFYNHIKFGSSYLMGCNAIKNGRDAITCEDVVVGYILILRLLTQDLRSTIRKAYNNKLSEPTKNSNK